jgi:cytochrome c oxidase cbb3-type subunit 1
VLYIASMWIAGVAQGLMWRAANADGTLTYSFAQVLTTMQPFYMIRLSGGALFLTGMLLMAWNVWQTVRSGRVVNDAAIPQAVHA